MSAFLKVSDMEFAYGEVTVLRGLDLEVEEGTISCVMGRNGVGKTTFYGMWWAWKNPPRAMC